MITIKLQVSDNSVEISAPSIAEAIQGLFEVVPRIEWMRPWWRPAGFKPIKRDYVEEFKL